MIHRGPLQTLCTLVIKEKSMQTPCLALSRTRKISDMGTLYNVCFLYDKESALSADNQPLWCIEKQ